jgi:hypothetical protein
MAKDEYGGITAQTKAGLHRQRDAEALLHAQRWLGAMYLAGYSVECLLKSKLMQRFDCHDLKELETHLRTKQLMRTADTVFSHQLYFLLQLTGALDRLRMNRQAWLAFATVNAWVPAWRYSPLARTKQEAKEFVDAVKIVTHWLTVNV